MSMIDLLTEQCLVRTGSVNGDFNPNVIVAHQSTCVKPDVSSQVVRPEDGYRIVGALRGSGIEDMARKKNNGTTWWRRRRRGN